MSALPVRGRVQEARLRRRLPTLSRSMPPLDSGSPIGLPHRHPAPLRPVPPRWSGSTSSSPAAQVAVQERGDLGRLQVHDPVQAEAQIARSSWNISRSRAFSRSSFSVEPGAGRAPCGMAPFGVVPDGISSRSWRNHHRRLAWTGEGPEVAYGVGHGLHPVPYSPVQPGAGGATSKPNDPGPAGCRTAPA